jgi:hypothetical protein
MTFSFILTDGPPVCPACSLPLILVGFQGEYGMPDPRTGADMTPCIPENFSTWLVDWSLVTGKTMPPRDPNDDDDDEDDDAEPDDEPAVIRDPDE